MKELIYFWLDVANYGILGFLLAELLGGMARERFPFRRPHMTAGLICLQFALVRMIFSWSSAAKQLVYGEDMLMTSSGQSILPMAVSMIFTLACGMILYQGERVRLLSLVTSFYALTELVRFTLYSASLLLFQKTLDFYGQRYLEGGTAEEGAYLRFLSAAEILWNLGMTAAALSLLWLCLRQYRKYLDFGEGKWRSSEAALLLVPGAAGLLLGMLLRSILFDYRSGEMYSIVSEHPETNLIIPCMSLLCILSLILTAKMLRQVTAEHEKRKQAEVSRSQMAEMRLHVREMEEVYDGIRGMKHDMRNYMADIRALLSDSDADSERGSALEGYVDSLQGALDRLDVNVQTGNPVINVILSRYQKLARERGIEFDCGMVYPASLGIDAFDLGVILNNALENALEACGGVCGEGGEERICGETCGEGGEERVCAETCGNGSRPFIRLEGYRRESMFLICVENSFDGILKMSPDSLPETRKAGDGHGFGLKNIQSCAEKYYGKTMVRAEGKVFRLTVMLQGRIGSCHS